MRIRGYTYLNKWNHRIPIDVVDFNHFGFIKAGLLFESRRVITWNEFRLKKLFKSLRMKDFSSLIYGFIDCPEDIGVFHHGCFLGDRERLIKKYKQHSHQESNNADWVNKILQFPYEQIPTSDLPINIKNGEWPESFFVD
jgi:hypothetical protein